jgi:hypothetical protein
VFSPGSGAATIHQIGAGKPDQHAAKHHGQGAYGQQPTKPWLNFFAGRWLVHGAVFPKQYANRLQNAKARYL